MNPIDRVTTWLAATRKRRRVWFLICVLAAVAVAWTIDPYAAALVLCGALPAWAWGVDDGKEWERQWDERRRRLDEWMIEAQRQELEKRERNA